MAEYVVDLYTDHDGVKCERVVRCRDCDLSLKDGTRCIFFAGWEPIAGGDEYELVNAEVEPDGFCKWGERRKES